MASDVFYSKFDGGETEASICRKIQSLFRAAGFEEIAAGADRTGVKTHFGERGNDSFVPPLFVKAVVDEVRAAGGQPCLIETSTLYRGQRHNAVDHFNLAMEHGFGPEAMGCPLLFVDGIRGNLHVEVDVGLKHFKTVAAAGDFTFIPSAMVVTHVTGHMLAGLGGALKNVAMGLASRAGKLRQHSDGAPHVNEAKCISCGTCARWCPEDAITVEDKAQINYDRCIGCGECVAVCPVGAVGFDWDSPAETFNEKMAEYALGILAGKEGRVGFITLIHRVTRQCNCMGEKGKSVCPDLGILASRDIVAIDQATVDLVNEAHGSDLFEEIWPGRHYGVQLSYGEEIGLGSRTYEMIDV